MTGATSVATSNVAFEPFETEWPERSIPERFEWQVARAPDRLAVDGAREQWSYRELNAAANRVAAALLEARGPHPEPVVLLLPHGPAMMAAMLGVLKAGKMYVPLDPALPAARTELILAESGASAVVANGATLASASALAGDAPVVDLDALGRYPDENPGLAIPPDAAAWLLFTSGSTGRPKGVVQPHRNALQFVRVYTNTLRIAPDDRLTMLFSLAVNGATHDIWSALLNGASLHLRHLKDTGIGGLAAWLRDHGVTIYASVPTVFRHFTNTLTEADAFPRLRVVKLVGEPVIRGDVERHRRHFGEACTLVNRFGSTETGTICWELVDRTTRVDGHVVPVGRAAEGHEVLLVDESGAPVPAGEVGEIAVRSRYVTPGYWRRPDLTAAAFLPGRGEERVYRMGDLGRLLPDGRLLCLGRRDSQVKIHGHRIECGDVEAALRGLPGIADTVVIARESLAGEMRLVAYLVAAGPRPTVSALRRGLAERLPEHMIPSAFVVLDALPVAPNGKVDRRALPAPADDRRELDAPFVLPRTPGEHAIAAIFARVLELPRVGVHDGFFDRGGDSLRALRLVTEIERRFGRRLPLASLLETPTVAGLAALLARDGWAPAWRSLVPVQPLGGRPPFYCVPGHTGTVLCFQPLARALGGHQPLLGLEPRGLDGRDRPQARIEEMAAAYLEEIRALQAHGPYHLAGYCFGGLVAFEMARQLRAQGEAVGLLALFDSTAPARVSGNARTSRPSLGRRLRVAAANLRPLTPRERVAYVAAALAGAGGVGRLARAWPPAGGQGDAHVRAVARAQSRASRTYRPGPYEGPAVLYRARHRLAREHADPASGWGGLVSGRLDVELIPASGGSVIQDPDGVRAVARDLERRLIGAR